MAQDVNALLQELGEASERFFEDEVLPTLSDYVRIRCLSPEFDADWEAHGEIARAAELLAGWARARRIPGLAVEVVAVPGLTPVVCCEIPASAPGDTRPTTLCYGHLDKQPPLGAWREGLDPFTPVREGDRLYGRGTADDGYSIFAALGALELAAAAGRPYGRCVVLIEASEESGSPHLGAYLDLLADRFGPGGPGLVVCLDSGAATYDRLWSTTSLRGLVNAVVRVDVLTEGIHSGSGGGVVPDSFRLLRQLLSRIEDEKTGEVLLDSCRIAVATDRRLAAERLVAELGGSPAGHFPVVGSLRLASGGTAADQLVAQSQTAALACTGLDGMPAVADAGNVLRPYTALKLALRIPPGASSTEVGAELVARLTADAPEGATVSVHDLICADGFDAPARAGWLGSAVDEASEALFGAAGRDLGEGGTIPFLSALATSYPDAQFLVTGVLGPESNAHGPNEMLHLPTATRLTAAVAHVLSAVPPR